MSNIPSYYVREPGIEAGGTIISINLTSGKCRRTPEGSRAFFEDILSITGIKATLELWSVQPFISRYYTPAKWQKCWSVRLIVSEKVKTPKLSTFNTAPVFTLPAIEVPFAKYFPIRVLANFTSQKAALKCRDTLKQYAATVKWNEIHYERYSIRNLGRRQKQLVTDVVTIQSSRLQEAIAAAEKAEAICENLGGRINA